MNKSHECRRMVVTHVSYLFLVFVAAVHVVTGCGVAIFIADITGMPAPYAFPPAYLALVALTVYLVLRNGRWAVDDEFIYKGWRLARFIAIAEIEHAQIGIPDNWLTAIARIPGSGLWKLAASMQSSALVLRLSGNRWLVWQFSAMVNRERFVNAVLERSPREDTDSPMLPIPTKLPLLKVGSILHS